MRKMRMSNAKRTIRYRGIICLALMVAAIGGNGLANADTGQGDNNKLDAEFLRRFWRDFGAVVASPFHWHGRDFLQLAAFSGASMVVYAFDQDIKEWAQEKRTSSSDDASRLVSYLGNAAVLLGLNAVLYGAGEAGGNDGLRKTALLSVESLAAAGFFVTLTKVIVGRARPYTGESNHAFNPLATKSSYWSFPSGHAACAFAVATTVAEQTDCAAVDIAAYSLAALVGLSRIHDNKHWASDVFFGSAVGYLCAKKISSLNRPDRKTAWDFGLQVSGSRRALTLAFRF
jgi:membrane-associated phospholipid phosphatase